MVESRVYVDLNSGSPVALQPGRSDSSESPRDSY